MFLFSISIIQEEDKRTPGQRVNMKPLPLSPKEPLLSPSELRLAVMMGFRGLFSLYKTLKSRALPDSKLYKTINSLVILHYSTPTK